MSSRRKFLKDSGMAVAGLGLSNVFAEEITAAAQNPATTQDPAAARPAQAPAQLPSNVGPDDVPNQPFGVEKGINPGRVVWAWDKNATNENATTYFWLNTNNELVYKMFRESVLKLTSKNTSKEAWDAIFKNFNKEKKGVEKGYTKGEKILVKINQTTARGTLRPEDIANGYSLTPGLRTEPFGACEQGIATGLALLRELVNEAGVAQEDILLADSQNPTFKHLADAWWAEFPRVKIGSKMSADHGRTLLVETEKELFHTSDGKISEKLYTVTERADYMINIAQLKPHRNGGITLTAKNHFGSHSKERSSHFHVYLPIVGGRTDVNSGYKKYRILTDMMGSKYMGRNTMIYIIDGLFGGGAGETGPPVKYHMAPFNNDWSNSLFMSLDQVALESVCYDFLRTEWDGVHQHDPSNNNTEFGPSVNGVDDYLHQAADSKHWAEGIVYDPDRSGKPMPSLGVHEHWNNAVKKQYSRNLGKNYGIELVSIPEKLVGGS